MDEITNTSAITDYNASPPTTVNSNTVTTLIRRPVCSPCLCCLYLCRRNYCCNHCDYNRCNRNCDCCCRNRCNCCDCYRCRNCSRCCR